MRPHRWLRRALGRIVLALVVLVAAAELGFRAFAAWRGLDADAILGLPNPEGGIYVPHPYIGYQLRPGSDDVNSMGLRGPETSAAKPAGVFRILCLGGSTTFGSGLRADEAYPARLQVLLDAEPAPRRAPSAAGAEVVGAEAAGAEAVGARIADAASRYEVLNCGVPGWSSAESLVAFALRLVELRPDAIVVYHGINDARLVQTRPFRPDYSHMRSAWREPGFSALEWWLWRNSRAWAAMSRLGGFGPKAIRLEDLIYVEGYADLYEPPQAAGVNREGVAAFLRNIDHIAVLARGRGIETLLATFAVRAPAGPAPAVRAPAGRANAAQGYAVTVAAMNQELRSYARERGLAVAELSRALDSRPGLFADAVHLNAEGTQEQAAVVLEAARAARLWGLR